MKSQLNEELLTAIKAKMPKNADIVNVLINIFPYMGKQAIYRRIRQEVPFLFDEVVKIAKELNISIDNIIGMADDKQAVFDFSELGSDVLNVYSDLLEKYIKIFQEMGESPDFKIRTATNSLPIMLYMPFENLSKFRLYKWIYQIKNDPELSFSKIVIPQKLHAIHERAIATINNLRSYQLIIDSSLFSSIIDEIRFFYKRNLITKEEMQLLKNELNKVLDSLVKLTTNGINDYGREVSIFLSSASIDTSYSYYENSSSEFSRIRIYALDSIDTQDANICKKQKQWIESLKKFSIMISQSGEIERINFFKIQRELISNMDNVT